MTRLFNGKFFECVAPGHWHSDDNTTSIRHVMQGTCAEQWEVYFDARGSNDPMDSGDLVGVGLTMGEAIAAWAR